MHSNRTQQSGAALMQHKKRLAAGTVQYRGQGIPTRSAASIPPTLFDGPLPELCGMIDPSSNQHPRSSTHLGTNRRTPAYWATCYMPRCSPGSIGEALAKEFLLHDDFMVCVTSLPGEELKELEALGANYFPVDVTSTESVEALRDGMVESMGDDLDILINCAVNRGINYVMPALDVDVEELKRIFDINLFGLVRMTQAFSVPLINRKGLIVNVGSLAAYAPYVFGSSYNASKAALLAYGNTLRIELSPWSRASRQWLDDPKAEDPPRGFEISTHRGGLRAADDARQTWGSSDAY
ncbi:NADPH-dependent 1-acyldihydroxyacetone phosphate reductase [Seiridium cupressi]